MNKTDQMVQAVGVDGEGALYTLPSTRWIRVTVNGGTVTVEDGTAYEEIVTLVSAGIAVGLYDRLNKNSYLLATGSSAPLYHFVCRPSNAQTRLVIQWGSDSIVYEETDESSYTKTEIDAALGDKITAPEAAEVGQTIVVSEVDENGKPTKWEAAELPSGGGGDEVWDILMNVTTEDDVSNIAQTTPPDGHTFDEYTEAVLLIFVRPNSGGVTTGIGCNLWGTSGWQGKIKTRLAGIADTGTAGNIGMAHVRRITNGWIPVFVGTSYNTGSMNNAIVPQAGGVSADLGLTYSAGTVPEDMTTILPNEPISTIGIGGWQAVLGAGSKAIVYGKRKA